MFQLQRLLLGESHHHTALAEIGLHELAALSVVLWQTGGVDHDTGFAFCRQCAFQGSNMLVEILVIGVQRCINAL